MSAARRALALFGLAVALAAPIVGAPLRSATSAPAPCPPAMVLARGVCIDRWEVSLVDAATGSALSPYYPALPAPLRRIRAVWERERRLLGSRGASAFPLPPLSRFQRTQGFSPRAVSRAGAVPNGYLSHTIAQRACEAAGKRLCTLDEWVAACRGEHDLPHPYGGDYVAGRCNVARTAHPAAALHGDASLGHLDPRLNLVRDERGEPLLALTGSYGACASRWGNDAVFDMVGNLDEWIADEAGTFVGGFYARNTKKGCDAIVSSHAAGYSDYSLGTRCCLDPR